VKTNKHVRVLLDKSHTVVPGANRESPEDACSSTVRSVWVSGMSRVLLLVRTLTFSNKADRCLEVYS
jgi:hypothetical protein